MTVLAIIVDDILGDIKRKDHIIFGVNVEGIMPNTGVGYGFQNRVAEEHSGKFFSLGEKEIGEVVSVFVEEENFWLHGVVNHSVREGWDPDNYDTVQLALDKLWAEHEDEVVRPMKTMWLGKGKSRQHGETKGSVIKGIQSLVNSKGDFVVYYVEN